MLKCGPLALPSSPLLAVAYALDPTKNDRTELQRFAFSFACLPKVGRDSDRSQYCHLFMGEASRSLALAFTMSGYSTALKCSKPNELVIQSNNNINLRDRRCGSHTTDRWHHYLSSHRHTIHMPQSYSTRFLGHLQCMKHNSSAPASMSSLQHQPKDDHQSDASAAQNTAQNGDDVAK
jgi:hypothetical protein